MHGPVALSFQPPHPILLKLAVILSCTSTLCFADTIYADQNKLFKSTRNVITLGPSLFGDKVNLNTGALEFVQTDVALLGNSKLPVSIGRRLVTGQEAKHGFFGN